MWFARLQVLNLALALSQGKFEQYIESNLKEK